MSKDGKKILVQYDDGTWRETDKESFEQGIKHLQKLSKNIPKYGIGAVDPSYVHKAKTASFARFFAIMSAIVVAVLLIILIIASID